MKKYRPYERFPEDIIGKVVKSKNGAMTIITTLSSEKRIISTAFGDYGTSRAFNVLEFPDGTPVGEEYEEVVYLIHDRVYCVRTHGYDWCARHYAEMVSGLPEFYNDGRSSLTSERKSTTAWDDVSEYDKGLIGTVDEPKNGYLYHRD